MPRYFYKCHSCKKQTDDIRMISDRNKETICECGGTIKRDEGRECSDNKTEITGFDNPRWSRGLGFHPKQLENMRKIHPNAVFDTSGKMVKVLVRNRKEKLRLIKERNKATGQGFYEID